MRLLRRTHVLDPEVWLRILVMLVCVVLFCVVFGLLIWLLVLFQILHTLLTGRPNRDLRAFAPKCGRYARDLLSFLTYAEDRRPWPFSSFDEDSTREAEAAAGSEDESAAAKSVSSRPRRKKS